jgi:hypothetical protein
MPLSCAADFSRTADSAISAAFSIKADYAPKDRAGERARVTGPVSLKVIVSPAYTVRAFHIR